MKRRLSIAIACLGNSKVIFLDEPTTGLDPITRSEIWKLIQEIRKGKSIILTTHYMEEAEALSDRIAILIEG
jgi:ABC-type multidrug transport system ATPase subunit